jgi:hypothetical protein
MMDKGCCLEEGDELEKEPGPASASRRPNAGVSGSPGGDDAGEKSLAIAHLRQLQL